MQTHNRTTTWLTSALALALVFALAFGVIAEDKKSADGKQETDSTEINWMTYDEASKLSETEGKHIFIHFTTAWCGWCRKMEQNTYTDPTIVKMMNKNFAPVQIWADSDKEVDIDGYKISQKALAASEFGVSSYPQYWFISPDNAKIGPLKGYFPAERFIKALEWVADYKYDTTKTDSGSSDEKASK